MNAPKHTLRFLKQRFAAAGIFPEARYGQNFLIDQNLLEILVEAAGLSRRDLVLEVGTGTGALTGRLAERAGHVLSIEIDSRLQQLARDELGARDNLTLLKADVLKNKNRLNPLVLETIDGLLRDADCYKLVANLPFNIATPLISNLLLVPRPPERMVVTIQKELADRILAPPRTKDYSSLSVWMQTFCDLELLRLLPPSVFWPRPKVQSAILLIKPIHERLAARPDLVEFHRFVRQVFLLRRKLLRGVLLAMYKPTHGKSAVDAVLAELGLNPQARAEELSVEQLDALFRRMSELARSVG